jgi:trimeric autotransporter adhesin
MSIRTGLSRRTAAYISLLVLISLFASASVQAITVCVNSVPLLEVALVQAQFQTQPVVAQLVQGTYVLDSDLDYDISAQTSIEGGYTANCAARVVNPANTVIDIGGANLFEIRSVDERSLTLEGFTLKNGSEGVHLGFSDVHLKNMRITQISLPSGLVGSVSIFSNTELRLENVLFDHLVSAEGCAVKILSNDGSSTIINHLTADLAAGDHFCMSGDGSQVTVQISNSVLWNSDGGNSQFVGDVPFGVVILVNNLSHGQSITGSNVVIQNQINANPGWISPATGNYRLNVSPLSPAINSGTFVVPGGEPATDIEGNSHFIGSAPDRGAYESAFSDQTVLIVSNTLDSGFGSLRQAITTANLSLSPPKEIKFDIRNASNVPICPAVIALNTVLPPITGRMTIDGYTQLGSSKNTSASAFNAQLCVMLKPAAGSLNTALNVPVDAAGGLTLRGLGIGGFGQPIRISGGQGSVIAGNQFGGTANGIALPGAGLNAITIGAGATGDLVVGGINVADRNVIGGAALSGIDNQANGASAATNCQVINNLIGLAPNGSSALANSFGVNISGSGCEIVGNRIAGNSITNLWLNGSNGNIVQRNQIGVTVLNTGFDDNVTGILVAGSNNIIGASGNGGAISGNTVRFNIAGGVVIRGAAVSGNSVKANSIHGNGFDGFSGQRMDIDLQATSAITGPTANDAGDADTGPNQLQNFPVPTALVYTGAGSIDRPANLSGVLDAKPGTYRVDAYFSNSANVDGNRGFAEVFLGIKSVVVGNVPAAFTLPILVPNQSAGGVLSFIATDSLGNTSEVGTPLSIVTPLIFNSSFE